MRPAHESPDAPLGTHTPFPLQRLDLLAIGAFWTLLAVLTAMNGMLDPRGGRTPAWSWSDVGFAFATSLVWALLTPAIFWFGVRAMVNRSRWIPRLLLLLAVGVMVAVFVEALTAYLRLELFGGFGPPPGGPPPGGPGGPPGGMGPETRDFNPLFGASRLFWLDDLIAFIAVLSAGFARDAVLRYRARQEETIRLQAQTAELHAQLADARLESLRRQLHPHFLFNTLHAVSSLVERDPRGVRRMIARLSDLLRFSIEGAETAEVTLRRELELLGRYVDIMQVRFQGRLEFEQRIDERALDALVPTLVLQPLVENAIKHGVETLTGPGRIEVEAVVDGPVLVLRVLDNGATSVATTGVPSHAVVETDGVDTARPGGVGLRNTVARLEQLHGRDARFTLQPRDPQGAIAEVRLPLRTAPTRTADDRAGSAPETVHAR